MMQSQAPLFQSWCQVALFIIFLLVAIVGALLIQHFTDSLSTAAIVQWEQRWNSSPKTQNSNEIFLEWTTTFKVDFLFKLAFLV